jgi:hypothetical protein
MYYDYYDEATLDYQHPKHVVAKHLVGKKYKGVNRKWRVQYAEDVRKAARNYFGQELMRGANIDGLRADPYWKYMED